MKHRQSLLYLYSCCAEIYGGQIRSTGSQRHDAPLVYCLPNGVIIRKNNQAQELELWLEIYRRL